MDTEKLKAIFMFEKERVKAICDKYDLSGSGAENAADMYQLGNDDEDHDCDGDGEGEGIGVDNGGGEGEGEEYVNTTIHAKFGHFNLEKAIRQGGDDRSKFLGRNPIDVLYWWHVLDSEDLITMVCVKLLETNRADCHTPPQQVSDLAKKKTSTADKDAIAANLGEMMETLKQVTKSVATFTETQNAAAEKRHALAVQVAQQRLAQAEASARMERLTGLEKRENELKDRLSDLKMRSVLETNSDARTMCKSLVTSTETELKEIVEKKQRLE